jgi:hypothetical protein
MMADFPVTKQLRQQGQRVLSEGRVNERRMSFEGLNRATAWLSVIVKAGIHDLRIKLGGNSQPQS